MELGRTDLLRETRALVAISLIAALFVLTAACGSSSTAPAAGESAPTAEAEHPPSSLTPAPFAASTSTSVDAAVEASTNPTPSAVEEAMAEVEPTAGSGTSPATSVANPSPPPTEPPLINTPVPVANTAPDFTLPSVQGGEYTLSQFRGEKPVAVVFYRAYW
jgi:hypothetical protein